MADDRMHTAPDVSGRMRGADEAGAGSTIGQVPDAAPPKPGLRERKRQRTHDAIVRATAELTLEVGFAAATIPKIAERADVAPRTVSTRFPVKEDILLGDVPERLARTAAELRDGDGDVVDRLERWMQAEGAHVGADHELTRLRNRAILSDPDLRARESVHFEALGDLLAEAAGLEVGAPADAVGPQVFAAAALGFLVSVRNRFVEEEWQAGEIETGPAFLRAGLAALGRS